MCTFPVSRRTEATDAHKAAFVDFPARTVFAFGLGQVTSVTCKATRIALSRRPVRRKRRSEGEIRVHEHVDDGGRALFTCPRRSFRKTRRVAVEAAGC